VVDALGVIDVDRHPLGTGHLDGEHLDAGQAFLHRLGDLPLKLFFLLVYLCHLPSSEKNGRVAPISPTGEMWSWKDSTRRAPTGLISTFPG
jgi:hypothetical protein